MGRQQGELRMRFVLGWRTSRVWLDSRRLEVHRTGLQMGPKVGPAGELRPARAASQVLDNCKCGRYLQLYCETITGGGRLPKKTGPGKSGPRLHIQQNQLNVPVWRPSGSRVSPYAP